MKILVITSLLSLIVRITYADPTTFEEFKSLSPEQRYALVSDDKDPLRERIIAWSWRLRLGEEAWQLREQQRLVMDQGPRGVENLFIEYTNLRGTFIGQEWRRKEAAGMTDAQKAEESARESKIQLAANAVHRKAIPLMAALAPTLEARALDGEASDVARAWNRRWPKDTSKEPAVTQADLTIMDQDIQKIMEQLKKLPKLPPEKVQSAIAALPPTT